VTGAKNNFDSNKSKKSFSKQQEQKSIFAARSAKKQFSKRKAPKNIFKATTAQETFSKRQIQQIHFKETSAKKIAIGSKNPFRKSKQKTVLKQQFCSKFVGFHFKFNGGK